jgi:chromodomain-helicase-DNA-binding protein 7
MQLDKEADDDDTDPMEVDESSSSSSEDDGNDKVVAKSSRRRGRAATAVDTTTTTTTTKTEDSSKTNNNRRSSRSTKCRHSMKEPSGESVRDLFMGVAYKYSSDDDDDDEAPISAMMKAKSPARRHSKHRKSLSQESADEESEVEEEEEEEEMKIQRILAARTETKQQWKAITQKMNTSEVTGGSRWFQDTGEDDNDTLQIEERFLVKWSGLSYLHVSWETQEDLLDQVDSAKTYLSTFFRKSQNGVLFGQDERKDGDYFDPGLIQIDRICEIVHEDASYKLPTNWEQEQSTKPTDFGICMDRKSDDFEDGTGRQILVKWMSANYSNCTYEFERDLLLQEIDYKQHLKVFYDRTNKLSKSNFKKAKDMADTARRKSYKLFGDQTDVPEATRNKLVQNYQQALAEHVYPNGGSLRDYQAEGVAWFLSNYINHRSCIMADEMGLGKVNYALNH